MRKGLWLCAISLLGPVTLVGQGTRGSNVEYLKMSEADEIAIARSAALPAVSKDADIWLARGGTYVLGHKGTNGNACIVIRLVGSQPDGIAPICYDPEAAKTIMLAHIRGFELRYTGTPNDKVDEALAMEFASGKLRAPSRPAMAYMLSPKQHLYGDNGNDVGNWKPHLMQYTPYLTKEHFGLQENTASVMVADEGKPNAFLMIIMPEFTSQN